MPTQVRIDGILNPSTVLKVGSKMLVNIIDENAPGVGVTVEQIKFTKGGFEKAKVDTLRATHSLQPPRHSYPVVLSGNFPLIISHGIYR